MAPTTSKTSTDVKKSTKGTKHGNNTKVKEGIRMDIVSNVPVEIAQIILMNLSPDDAISAWKCNRRWKNIMNDEYFWETKCIVDKFYEHKKEEKKSKVYNSFIEKFSHWQGVYMYQERLQRNWKNNTYAQLNIPHVNHYHRLHYFDDNMLIASTTRNMIRVIDSSTGKINSWFASWVDGKFVKVFKRGNFLLAYNTNNGLKVWDTTNKMCVLDMELVTKLNAVEIHQNLLVLGYDDGMFSVLNVESGLSVYYEQTGSPVRCISFYNEFVFTGRENGFIHAVDILKDSQNKFSFVCCPNRAILKIIIVSKGYMISFAIDGTICVFTLNSTVDKLHTIYAHSCIPHFVTYEDQFFCIGLDGISIEVWNFVTGIRLFHINNQVPITYLRTNGSQVIACSAENNLIKMWCLNTGKFISQVEMELHINNIKGIFCTKKKLVYFGYKKSCKGVMCIRNYEL